MALGRYAEAIVAYNQTLIVSKNDAAVWYNKALALNHLKLYNEALEACDHALRLDPENAAAWLNKGNALIELAGLKKPLSVINTPFFLTLRTLTHGTTTAMH